MRLQSTASHNIPSADQETDRAISQKIEEKARVKKTAAGRTAEQ